MKIVSMALLVGSVITAVPGFGIAQEAQSAHAVFVMTNSAEANEVIAYERTEIGTLRESAHYKTEGRGSGGTVDPLASQGSLSLSRDGLWLFATNAGSGSLTAFRVAGSRLWLTDHIATEGSEPNSVAQYGNLVYVLNTAGSSSVAGFYFDDGKLVRIGGSLRFLSANAVGSGSVAFSPDGRFLVVTEKVTNSIDVFAVLPDGTLGPLVVNKNVGAGTFSATFAQNGMLIVAETGAAGTNASAVSSYAVEKDGSVSAITASVPTLGAVTCWVAFSHDGRFVYTSSAGTSTVSGFAIAPTGVLSPLPGTVLASNPPGSANLDIAVSADGRFAYTLNAGTGTIGQFALDPSTGALTSLGVHEGLPAGAGLNGIAAN